jgi:hypothetical protein
MVVSVFPHLFLGCGRGGCKVGIFICTECECHILWWLSKWFYINDSNHSATKVQNWNKLGKVPYIYFSDLKCDFGLTPDLGIYNILYIQTCLIDSTVDFRFELLHTVWKLQTKGFKFFMKRNRSFIIVSLYK